MKAKVSRMLFFFTENALSLTLKLYLSNIRPYFATLMKRQRLKVDYEIDFEVFGIVSSFRDYKLAWNLNRKLHITLTKQQDLRLRFINYDLVVSNFLYETENSQFCLIKNRGQESNLNEGIFFIPELTEMDYFLRITDPEAGSGWMDSFRETPGIDFVKQLDIERLKSKENFIF